MDDFTLARVVHVAAVLLWIGGVAFVTMVAMPQIARNEPEARRLSAFHRLEGGFAWQARIWVALAGASGFWMVWRANLWSRFLDLQFWWMGAMLAVWLAFALMLYVLEPLVMHRRMADSPTPQADFRRMQLMHRLLLAASLVALAGAVGGSHGLW
jgi:uncharacterized membrane protein